MSIQPVSPIDIFVWHCGTKCYRSEAHHYVQLGHEYAVLPAGTPEQVAASAELDGSSLETSEAEARPYASHQPV